MAVKAGCDGNFQDGLCCRMVIETKRVFDGCAFTDENVSLALTTEQQIPQQAVFVSARVIDSELIDYVVTNGADGCCRVCGDIVTRFAVTYSVNGVLTTVQAVHRASREVLLHLPSADSLVPFDRGQVVYVGCERRDYRSQCSRHFGLSVTDYKSHRARRYSCADLRIL